MRFTQVNTIYSLFLIDTFKGHLDKHFNFSHCKIEQVLSCSDSYMLVRSLLPQTAHVKGPLARNLWKKSLVNLSPEVYLLSKCISFVILSQFWPITENIKKQEKVRKARKKVENYGKIGQKMLFKVALKSWLRVLFPKKHVFISKTIFTNAKRCKKMQKDALKLKTELTTIAWGLPVHIKIGRISRVTITIWKIFYIRQLLSWTWQTWPQFTEIGYLSVRVL